VVISGTAVNVVAVAELIGLVSVRAVSAAASGVIAAQMVTSGGNGIPYSFLQPKDQDPKFPKNSNGDNYFDVKYPDGHDKAGQRIEFPGFDKSKAVPKDQRSVWNGVGKTGPIKGRTAYKKEWKQPTGTDSPPGGWDKYEIHHIQTLENGGTNTWENLVPVLKDVHRTIITPWWNSFKP